MQAACFYVFLVTQSSELCEVVLVVPCIEVSCYVYFNFSAIYAWPLPEATFGSGVGFHFGVKAWAEMGIRCVKGI